MKKRTKIDFDKESGTTVAQLTTSIGTFFGYAQIHPDDPFPPSYSVGEKIAEARAYLNFYEEKKKEKKNELKGLQRLLNAMPSEKEGYKYAKNLYRAIKDEISELEFLQDFLIKRINAAIESRGIYIRSRTTDKKAKEEYLKNLGNAINKLGEVKNN